MRICRGIRISLRVCLRTGRVLSYICSRIPVYWGELVYPGGNLYIWGGTCISVAYPCVFVYTGRVFVYTCSRILVYRPRIGVYLLAHPRVLTAYLCVSYVNLCELLCICVYPCMGSVRTPIFDDQPAAAYAVCGASIKRC